MTIAARGARLLGGALRDARRIAGGDLSEVLRVELRDGRIVIVKVSPQAAVEAEMLAAIRAAGVPAPRVLAHDGSLLVLEALPGGADLASAWRDLGSVLARLHAVSGDRYGWHVDYAFGRVAIDNRQSRCWPEFWSARRLVNHLPELPADLARRVEALARDLGERLPASPQASLLHGDLWSGNVLASGARISGLIDPACYYGDREVDLAMLSLFSRPDPELFAAYGSLAPGSRDRLPVYQLWPALVHLRLFGPAYRPMVERLLTALGC